MGIYKSKEVLKQVIVRKPDHKLQIKITVDISTHALEWVNCLYLPQYFGQLLDSNSYDQAYDTTPRQDPSI